MAVIFACRYFSAADAKTLRAAVGTFYDLLGLATRTLEAFAPQEDDRVARQDSCMSAQSSGPLIARVAGLKAFRHC